MNILNRYMYVLSCLFLDRPVIKIMIVWLVLDKWENEHKQHVF